MEYATPAAIAGAVLVVLCATLHLTVLGPYFRDQRIRQAEQAERELLEEDENQSKRGSNKQAKKK